MEEPKIYGILYLRDLSDQCREAYEKEIRKTRPDLVKALDEGEDIEVGGTYRVKDFYLA